MTYVLSTTLGWRLAIRQSGPKRMLRFRSMLLRDHDSGPFFQNADCGAKVVFGVSGGHGSSQHLLGERGGGRGDVQRLRRFERQSDVLGHPLCSEVGFEIARENEGSLIGDEAALGGAVVQNVEHELGS